MEKEVICGERINLKPATLKDKRMVYEWASQTDITKSMMGLPTFPDQPIPTWEKFNNDYKDYYFDGSKPELGRGYLICTENETVGFVNYNDINFDERYTELDIWLKSESYCGKGYGSDAILTLCKFLKENYNLNYVIMEPSKRNPRAIQSYKNAGFKEVPLSIKETKEKYGPGDYYDGIYMLKQL